MKRSRALLFLAVIVGILCLLSSCNPKVEDFQYGSITGRALYSNGENHSGILLTLDKTDGLRAISASDGSKAIEGICYSKDDGSYEFYNLAPGTYTIYASSNDAVEKAVSTNVYVAEGKAVSVEDLNLTATGKISGKISVDGNNTGNEGFLVFVAGTSFMAATDSTGKYTITGIPAGTDYPVIASKGNYTVSLGTCDVNALGTSSMQAVRVSSDDILSGNNSIIWKGSYTDSSALSNPKRNWAYYNTTDGCSYIYNCLEWTLLASKGEQGIQGEQGDSGAQGEKGEAGAQGPKGEQGIQGETGAAGVSIVWLGSFSEAPEGPAAMNAYYNSTTGCSYLYDGTQWALLASKGDQGEQGIQGPQGDQGIQGETGATGSTGATGAAGISIVWLGSFSEAPESPEAMNAYYSTTSGCSYIYDGTQWALLASKGDQGEQGIQGPQGEQGHSVVVDLGFPCTCTEDGLTDGAHCVICGEILIEQVVIPATGHSFSEEWTTDYTHHWHIATCEHTEQISEYGEHSLQTIIEKSPLNEDTYVVRGICTVCEANIELPSFVGRVGEIGPTGGYIFYDCDADNDSGNADNLISSECGWRFLEAAPADLMVVDGVPTIDKTASGYSNGTNRFVFGYYRTTDEGRNLLVNGTTNYYGVLTSQAIGTGKTNTQLLVNAMGTETYSSESGSSKTSDYAARLCDILIYTVNGVAYDDWFLPSAYELHEMFIQLKKKGLCGFCEGYYWSSSENTSYDAWYKSFYNGNYGPGDRGFDFLVRPIRAF